jgi:ribosome-associated protein
MPTPSSQPPENALHFASEVWLSPRDLQFTFSRSSGPGGQAVNKLSTRAQLRVPISKIHGMSDSSAARLRRLAGRRLTADDQILIEAETYRSQLDNKQACIERLTAMVKQALIAPKVRKKKRPTRSMIEKRLKTKRQRSEAKTRRRSRRKRNSDFE